MGKKKKVESAPLSKKERKALEAREAELAAELARREKKAAKKAGKKGKAEKKASKLDLAYAEDIEREAKGAKAAEAPLEHPHLDHLDRVGKLADAAAAGDEGAKAELEKLRAEGEAINALRAERAERAIAQGSRVATPAEQAKHDAKRQAQRDAETDDEIRARVLANRKAREGQPGSPERLAKMADDVAIARAERHGETAPKREHIEALDADEETADHSGEYKPTEAEMDAHEAEKYAAQVVDEVETETGRIFEAGTTTGADDFAQPSDAPVQLEEGRNGYKIMQLGADGKPDPRKVRQMTRVTTFVGNIDDETNLRDWEKRLLAEGLAKDATAEATLALIPKLNDLRHRYDVKVAKARKADRKGKLGIGELASLEDDAAREYKKAANEIVDAALELAGRNAKADAGTNLHALAELADEKGIDAVRDLAESGEISATDLASIEAYRARMDRLGAKVIESEAVIVNDELGYAGRLDRIIMAKLPELVIGRGTPSEYVRPADQRSRRYVADIKSGRIDYGAGKISRQLAAYALGDLYDLETGERRRHSAARDIALVFHLPQGAGTCAVHAVDIKTGTTLLKLSAEVRRARNTGRKTIDTTVDIADPAPEPDDAPTD